MDANSEAQQPLVVQQLKRTLAPTTAKDTATETCREGSSTPQQHSLVIQLLQRAPAAPAGVSRRWATKAPQKLSAWAEAETALTHGARDLARICVEGMDLGGAHERV